MRAIDKQKILVICPSRGDMRELSSLGMDKNYTFIFHTYSSEDLEKLIYEEGHEEGKNPDLSTLFNELVHLYQNGSLAGVVSSDDYPGITIASMLSKVLGLPGPDPELILLCQHKYFARIAQQKHVPQSVPRFALVDPKQSSHPLPLPLPFFLKPVKSYFSCFAQSITSLNQFRVALKQSVPPPAFLSPFNQLLKPYPVFEHDASFLIAEELLEGVQGTIEGYASSGKVEILGIVDSIMYPGTICFKQFAYPSTLSFEVQSRMAKIAQACMEGIGFNEGMFNIEFMYNPSTDTLHIIEINPRMASQFADLYEKVDGTNSYELLVALGIGKTPVFKRRQGLFKAAASCVLREFENKHVEALPTQSVIEELRKRFPELRVRIFVEEGKHLAHTLQDGKSYRYGLIHLGGENFAEIEDKLKICLSTLNFKFRPLRDSIDEKANELL